jgi:hypothetical protein
MNSVIIVYISYLSPYDGLSAPKHVVSGIIKIFVFVAVTPPFLFLSTTNRMEHYKVPFDVWHMTLKSDVWENFVPHGN